MPPERPAQLEQAASIDWPWRQEPMLEEASTQTVAQERMHLSPAFQNGSGTIEPAFPVARMTRAAAVVPVLAVAACSLSASFSVGPAGLERSGHSECQHWKKQVALSFPA